MMATVSEAPAGTARRRDPRAVTKTWVVRALLLSALVACATSAALPLYWTVLTSFRPDSEIFAKGINLLPTVVTLDNYAEALRVIPLITYALNTLLIAVVTIATNMVFCSLAGYAFAKLEFAGKRLIYWTMLVSVMVPGTVLLIPQFLVLVRFPLAGGNDLFGQGGAGFSGSLIGVVLPMSMSVFNIFFMRAFYLSMPDDIGEAARIDGAGEARIFFQIYAPLSKPALGVLTIFCFQAGWNAFLWPSIILRGGDFKVLTQGLQSFTFNNSVDYGPMMAATVIATLPVVVVFIFAQRYFVQGIAFSGNKD